MFELEFVPPCVFIDADMAVGVSHDGSVWTTR